MDANQYSVLRQLEDSHWWFIAKRQFLAVFLRSSFENPVCATLRAAQNNPSPKASKKKILDLGCGTGGTTQFLTKWGSVVGVEQNSQAVEFARKRNLVVIHASTEQTTAKSTSQDVVTILDVLYHQSCDPDATLDEAWRVLKPGGLLVVFDCAQPWLFSPHDKVMRARERFSRNSLEQLVSSHAFSVERSTYLFGSTYLPFVLERITQRIVGHPASLRSAPSIINALAVLIFQIEARFLKHYNLPFGSSVAVIARKPLTVQTKVRKPVISIILPTYNEASSIGKLLTRIQLVLPVNWIEVLVVDDSSTDGTATIVCNFAQKYPWIKLLQRSEAKRNLGESILHGLRLARGKIVIGMDADGNHRPEDLPRLLRTFAKTQSSSNASAAPIRGRKFLRPALVVCSRFENLDGAIQSWRSWASWCFNAFLYYGYKLPVRDSTSGFYALLNAPLMKLSVKEIYSGYGEYHIRLVARANQAKWAISEVGIVYGKRLGGKSKSQLFHMFGTYLATAKAESRRCIFPEKSQKSC